MEFRIADTFTDSLARLTGDEQRAVKTAAFDLQVAPAHPSLQFHKLDKAKDPRFWSVRVRADLRLIIHRSETSLLLCYVDHHDKAYQWGERRKVGDTPEDGSGAIGGDPGDGGEIQVGKYVEAAVQSRAKPLLFAPSATKNY